ncbi:MAG: hypothetical protein D6690_10005 [Nitrospirae bacterium]|nr:MAG: hypothetical protein D6690_10005 [Nitrospirota bacterium]
MSTYLIKISMILQDGMVDTGMSTCNDLKSERAQGVLSLVVILSDENMPFHAYHKLDIANPRSQKPDRLCL